jgi:hypothetical protein
MNQKQLKLMLQHACDKYSYVCVFVVGTDAHTKVVSFLQDFRL